MSNSFFRFKQFTIHHDRCGMKVGTDGVLLGAWGHVDQCRNILDIGTGSGLIALMAAQRNSAATVLGIEVEQQAAVQATENVAASPFKDRVHILHADILGFEATKCFDAVLCNPPYYTEHTLPSGESRILARNASILPLENLVQKVASLLTPDGYFSVILPHSMAGTFTGYCISQGLFLRRKCEVKTSLKRPPKKVMLTYSPSEVYIPEYETITLMDGGSRSAAYQTLTDEFYL